MKGAFYNSNDLKSIKDNRIIIDTNILAHCSSDEQFFKEFLSIFDQCLKLIDPIVKLEFLRGAKSETLFNNKTNFLELNDFYEMPDHQSIYKRVMANSFNVARVYAHNDKPSVKLGDILIMSRMMIYEDNFFATIDKNDFTTLLFDRVAVVSIEHKTQKNELVLEHICILKFNKSKYEKCLENLAASK